MIVVLDTNVIVSGLLSPRNPPGKILDLLLNQALTLALDERILNEYRDVLERPKFDFDMVEVDSLLKFISDSSHYSTPSSLPTPLLDKDDQPFLEVAIATPCPLITGNLRHYPAPSESLIPILTPSEFVALIRE